MNKNILNLIQNKIVIIAADASIIRLVIWAHYITKNMIEDKDSSKEISYTIYSNKWEINIILTVKAVVILDLIDTIV